MVTTPLPTILGSYPDFSSANFLDLQSKLKDKCESALFNAIVRHGKKAEEILWTKLYHEPMQAYKRHKSSTNSRTIKSLQLHFLSGVGFYIYILKKLFDAYSLEVARNLADLIKELKFSHLFIPEKSKTVTSADKEAAILCAHTIFVHLGDLFRYLNTLGYPESRSLALKWYHGAILFQPSISMPYNQLGTLLNEHNYGLDSAYFYMRCILCDKPFDGAESNLRRILQSCPKFLEEEMDRVRDSKGDDSAHIVKKCTIQLLIVAGEFFNQSKRQQGMKLASLIQDYLTTLTIALELPPKGSNSQKPTYLNPSLIFRMGTMTLMFLTHLQMSYIDSGIFYSAAIALALNFLLLNVNAFIRNFKDKIGQINLSSPAVSPVYNGLSVNNSSFRTSKANTPELSPRRALSRLRRRKAAITYDDIDTNFLDFGVDSDLSEAEETALSTFDALEIGSDISDNEGSVCEEEFALKLGSDDDLANSSKLVEPSRLTHTANIDIVLRYLYYDTSLPTIKTLCDWLRVDKELVAYSVESVDGLFSQFTEMTNLLRDIAARALKSNPKLDKFKYTGLNWAQKYPLSSDLNLLKFKLFEKYFTSLLENVNEDLTPEEMGFITVECIISFGEFLTEDMAMSKLSNRSQKIV